MWPIETLVKRSLNKHLSTLTRAADQYAALQDVNRPRERPTPMEAALNLPEKASLVRNQ